MVNDVSTFAFFLRPFLKPRQSNRCFARSSKREESKLQNRNGSDVKPQVNLKGGKTYVVKCAAVNQRPSETSLVHSGTTNQSDYQNKTSIKKDENAEQKQVVNRSVSEGSNTQRDVCKYLWQAALKGTADSFGVQEMIRAFLEGRLGSYRVKTVFDSMKADLLHNSEFESVSVFNSDELLDYAPLFMKLAEQENL